MVDEHGHPPPASRAQPPPEALMNFVYNPKVQADIAEYVNYVTPVRSRRRSTARAPTAETGLRSLSIAALQTAPVPRDPAATLDRLAERTHVVRTAVPHAQLLMEQRPEL